MHFMPFFIKQNIQNMMQDFVQVTQVIFFKTNHPAVIKQCLQGLE